ncbi:hypothetical protein RRG08_022999 [Elysia crispata]|uniref:Uncharacterized protein n=1 Tax=Elysia crispata TaxID=231223 RepID=A0AAE1AEY8_9GAST|nr:hypothetical protein RRG08_022999 [Elysia crispata]
MGDRPLWWTGLVKLSDESVGWTECLSVYLAVLNDSLHQTRLAIVSPRPNLNVCSHYIISILNKVPSRYIVLLRISIRTSLDWSNVMQQCHRTNSGSHSSQDMTLNKIVRLHRAWPSNSVTGRTAVLTAHRT